MNVRTKSTFQQILWEYGAGIELHLIHLLTCLAHALYRDSSVSSWSDRAPPQYEPRLSYLLTRLLPELRSSSGNTIFGPGDVQDKSPRKRVELAQRDRLRRYMSRQAAEFTHFPGRLTESRVRRDCVVVEAVCSQPVSAAKFPDNRENTGNFVDLAHDSTTLWLGTCADSMT